MNDGDDQSVVLPDHVFYRHTVAAVVLNSCKSDDNQIIAREIGPRSGLDRTLGELLTQIVPPAGTCHERVQGIAGLIAQGRLLRDGGKGDGCGRPFL